MMFLLEAHQNFLDLIECHSAMVRDEYISLA
jgi:hypothetical protein